MSTDDHLKFRGKDIEECEQFIVAVTKRAHAEGKLRDDGWIADFVATCLTGESVIWWSLLDMETQGSWYLLRKEMIARFSLSFYGRNGAEAEDFIYQVRQRALRAGKLNDQPWIAEFASECFVGSALRWYTSLDLSVRGDWDVLQRAILTQYGQELEGDSSSLTVPTQAPAAAPLIPTNRRYRGRIRVCRKDSSDTYYLSKLGGSGARSDQPGRVMATSVLDEVLEVEYELPSPSNGQHALIIPDGQIKGYDQLGIKWWNTDIIRVNSLATCAVKSSSGMGSLGHPFVGPVLMTPWRISLPDERGAQSLIGMSASGNRLFAVSNAASLLHIWFRQTRIDNEVDVELLFEPI